MARAKRSPMVSLANDLAKAKLEWQKAKLQRDEAAAALEYAQKLMTLTRDRFELEFDTLPEDDAIQWEVDGSLDDFLAVRYVGKGIREAVRGLLERRRKATTDQLVRRLSEG